VISFKHAAPDEAQSEGLGNSEEETNPDIEESTGVNMFVRVEKQEKRPRKVVRRNYSCVVPPKETENVLIMDNAADQSVVGRGFHVLFQTGQSIQIDGAMIGMKGKQYPLVCAAAVVEDPTSSEPLIILLNQAAYNDDPKQHELLLHVDQACFHGIRVNDLASCFLDGYGNEGKQSIETEGRVVPLLHDGSKYFVRIWEPTDEELEQLPTYELTSPMPWNPMEMLGLAQ
jgi:hypothetical protein